MDALYLHFFSSSISVFCLFWKSFKCKVVPLSRGTIWCSLCSWSDKKRKKKKFWTTFLGRGSNFERIHSSKGKYFDKLIVNNCKYCKLVKVRMLCILCNNWCLFRLRSSMLDRFGIALYTVWVEFPRLSKIDRLYIITETDRV
jgi:hypothetical protein